MPLPQTPRPDSSVPDSDARRSLPSRRDIAFGTGGLLESWGLVGIKNTANQVLNIVLEVNPVLIGTTFAITRLWDAFCDPIVGSFSDNLQTRWGRRRPLIVTGALLCGLLFPLMWFIPVGMSLTAQTIWLIATGIAFYTAHAIFSVPYQAFGYEIAPGYHEKTRLFATRAAFGTLHGLVVAWVFPMIQTGWLGDPRESTRVLAVLLAIVFTATGVMPALLVRRKTPLVAVKRPPKIPLRVALRHAASSRHFVAVAGATAISIAGLNAVTVLGTYVNIYYVHQGDIPAAAVIGGVQFTISVTFILLCMPMMPVLSRRFGKRNALFVCLGLAILGTIAKWFCYDPAHPYWVIGVVFLLGPANAGLRVFSDAMIADVCEYERAERNVSVEGVFGAVYAWLMKVGLALAVLASGLILAIAGFDIKLGADQGESTLLSLRILFSFAPLITLLAACWLLSRFRLSPEIMADVRRRLSDNS